jgi:glyoxylase-like metal-dependent hydrolase (beta-lactamase superfamily II)
MKMPIALAVVLFAAGAAAQTDFSKVEVKATPLGSGLAMLAGAGGNIVASAGEDGVFIVDDEFAELHPKIRAALAKMSDRPVRFVINTHWHGDHTGDNANLAGEGAVIIAQDNVFRRMSTEQFIKHLNRTVPASPKAALPVVTFNDEATLHLNGQAVHLVHVKNAHTDGDVLVHFPEAGVLHMGDCFFNGMYPIIDTGTGGTIDGYVATVDRGLVLAAPGTKVVPGHGTLGTREDLAAFSAMLKEARTAIAAAKAAGKSADETVAAKPTAALDERWGKGFVKPDAFVLTVYDTLPAR